MGSGGLMPLQCTKRLVRMGGPSYSVMYRGNRVGGVWKLSKIGSRGRVGEGESWEGVVGV